MSTKENWDDESSDEAEELNDEAEAEAEAKSEAKSGRSDWVKGSFDNDECGCPGEVEEPIDEDGVEGAEPIDEEAADEADYSSDDYDDDDDYDDEIDKKLGRYVSCR